VDVQTWDNSVTNNHNVLQRIDNILTQRQQQVQGQAQDQGQSQTATGGSANNSNSVNVDNRTRVLFRNRSGAAYSRFTLPDDFKAARDSAFPNDTRTPADIRRSGAMEARAGSADPSTLSAKMANSISVSNALHKAYGSDRRINPPRRSEDHVIGEEMTNKSWNGPRKELELQQRKYA
jgi:hypothetical protein